eukprot:TRINITY_DN43033_c0_g1_i1.p1 TRINITY_DN43033_c0_g1~~TRINITY_DN43033_c0_g1_i1.p1  ORF type:complete len:694 (-),score=154.48 TRINITY_DN43033_c0_g1_i1:56-2137(-)
MAAAVAAKGIGSLPPTPTSGVGALRSPAGVAGGTAGNAAAAGPSAHLAKKIQNATALRIDSQASQDALRCLSGFFDDNTVHTRRNLRSTIEGQNLLLHQEFVKSFSAVEAQVEALDRLVQSLDSASSRAAAELRRGRSETQGILEKAGALRNEAKVIEQKQEVLNKFLGKFRLSEKDAQMMKSGDRPIDEDFFQAFGKLEEVRANARQMLNACGQQTSGVDILHETSEMMEASYERLFVWVQQQCRGPQASSLAKQSPSEFGETSSGAVLKKALSLLSERPVYFNHCIRDLSRVRRQALVQRFFDALSSRGDGVTGTRPLEIQAGDPERYIGDMLAWIHQNTATEKDAVSVLMGRDPKNPKAATGGGASAPEVESSDLGLTLVSFEDIMDLVLEGLVAPFSNRVKQALESQISIVVVYKVAQVFSLFAKTLEELLGRRDACLVVMCRELNEKTHQSFLEMWEASAQKLRQGVVGIYVSDLGAPPFVTEAVNTLTEVLNIYESALVPEEDREADFLPILCAGFDPLLNHCKQVAAVMDAADGQVFLLNCVSAMQAPVRQHKFTAVRVEMYTAIIADLIQHLVDGQASAVLAKLGLAERLRALRERAPGTPISAVPELHPVSLEATLRSFYNSLFTLGGALALPILERVSNRTLRSEARSGVAKLISAAYEELYDGIKELGVATHTPEQVRTLLE